MAKKTNFWPLDQNISKEKNIDKIIFFLNDSSKYDKEYSQFRFIMKGSKCLEMSVMAEKIDAARSVVYRIWNRLLEIGYIMEEEDRYTIDPGALFFRYFPDDYDKEMMLKFMLKDSLPVLFYLANNYLYFTKQRGLDGYTFSQGQILRNVWGMDSDNNSRAHNKVRKIIQDLCSKGLITLSAQKTQIGKGYYYKMVGFNPSARSYLNEAITPRDESIDLSSLAIGEDEKDKIRTSSALGPNDF